MQSLQKRADKEYKKWIRVLKHPKTPKVKKAPAVNYKRVYAADNSISREFERLLKRDD